MPSGRARGGGCNNRRHQVSHPAVCYAGDVLARDLGIDEAELATSLEAIRTRWPEAPAPDAAFAAYVAERKTGERLRLEDLYLAWWCTRGDSRAIAAFDEAHAEIVERLLQRFHRLDADELRQRLRVKLFVGERARIRDYAGAGFLANWVKVIAARTFVDAAREHTRERADPLPPHADAVDRDDPRGAAQRAEVIAVVKRALDTAITALPSRERTYLRHVIIDGLTQEQIAATYAVHRVTVARALASARQQLHEMTRGLVIAELGSVGSTLLVIDSQLDLSLQRLFPEPTL